MVITIIICRYQQDRAQLEEQFQNGALAQQAMLEEKEVLAQKLQEEVSYRTLTMLEFSLNNTLIFIFVPPQCI